MQNRYEIGFFRTRTTEVFEDPPINSCTWQETEEKIHRHFANEREYVAFYYIHDNYGTNVWAQWDGDGEMLDLNLMSSFMNISLELDCLYPLPDYFTYYIVDSNGEIIAADRMSMGESTDIEV